MSQQIFITKFNYSLPTVEFKKLLTSVADKFKDIPGCQWKIWLLDEEKKEAGGIYLFDDSKSLDDFRKGPLFGSVTGKPGFCNFETRVSAIAEKASAITNAPMRQFDFF